MALYSVRSERQFCEQLDYNLLFRWFLDMDMTEASFDATAFTHNRARLIAHDVAGADSAHRDRPDRRIVIARIGHRDRPVGAKRRSLVGVFEGAVRPPASFGTVPSA